ncbi:glycoside hydrolase family 31 protein [Lacrimispora brassicae]
MQNIYKLISHPRALEENIIQGDKYRITMLTEGLVRLEYSEDGCFEDRPTQTVINRNFPKSGWRLVSSEDGIEIHTSRLHLIYNEKEFSRYGLSIQVKGNLSAYHSIWHYSEEIMDLGGTARTLDLIDGPVPLDHGIVSRYGYSVLEDSKSQILREDGWIEPRKKGVQDLYFFGYGHDYKEALNDFYDLCGKTPMLPRYALGNWWSRYYQYTEDSYLELMERFKKENLPFTVAVIDMDWHLVDIDPKYGSGWTGYTWNKDFFPDPRGFLKKLHDRGLHVSMNVHPADGVQGHEEMYKDMAKALGVNYEQEDPIVFDPASPEFMDAYFKYLHHPREDEGVDFWWIDWQQGGNCKVEGLDPLWILNHYHFLDSKRNGRRPMTFSRYGGPGSHRYPVGFSGDSITTWSSLDFQPYFTSTASNVGYGWWSHDIGGHMQGYKNDEMAARWFQLGVYSPIMRLHSSSGEFNGKEPWRFKKESETAMGEALRQRHRMMPYLYTMNYRNYKDNLPLVMPMYYEHPEESHAYEVPNQFYFGSELIVAPITTARISGVNAACVKVWLPKGIWYDLHTGLAYEGGRRMNMYRSLDSIPVLAKGGGILPFTDEISGVQAGGNPDTLRIQVYMGADGAFTLYEDDNESCDYETDRCVRTRMEYREGVQEAVFTICPARGELSLIPKSRSYTIEITGCRTSVLESVRALTDGQERAVHGSYDKSRQAAVVEIKDIDVTKELSLVLPIDGKCRENNVVLRCFDFLNQAEIEFALKDRLYGLLCEKKPVPVLVAELNSMKLDSDLYGVLLEIITAR